MMMNASIKPPPLQKPLIVFSAVALRPAMVPLLAEFYDATGIVSELVSDFSTTIAWRMIRGERCDLVLTDDESLDRLLVAGALTRSSVSPFGQTSLAIGVRRDHAPLDFSTCEAVQAAFRSVTTIGYGAEGVSGKAFRSLLQRLNLFADLAEKLRSAAPGDAALGVARGEFEVCVVLVPTILAAGPEVRLAGTIPAGCAQRINFSLAIHEGSRRNHAAEKLRRFLLRKCHDDLICGVELK